MSRRLVG
jgi:hypothetical protein